MQGTATADVFVSPITRPAFQQSPSLSANGSVVSFSSTVDLTAAHTNNDYGVGLGNAEVYVGDFNGTALGNIRQVTKTETGNLRGQRRSECRAAQSGPAFES